jgi:hypothetical protein
MRGYSVKKSLFSTQKMLRVCGTILLGLAFSTSATAGSTTVYKWVKADGTRGYSDSQKRVPKEYRAKATTQKITTLSGYSKLTLEKGPEQKARLKELNERIAHLKELNASLDAVSGTLPAVSSAPPGPSIIAGSSSGNRGGSFEAVGIPFSTGSDSPIVIEKKRMLDPESRTTRTNTIYKQDGKVIAVLRGQPVRDRGGLHDKEPDYN